MRKPTVAPLPELEPAARPVSQSTSVELAHHVHGLGEDILWHLSGRFTVLPVFACDLGELVDSERIQACWTVRTPAATSFFYYVDLDAARAAFDRHVARMPSGRVQESTCQNSTGSPS